MEKSQVYFDEILRRFEIANEALVAAKDYMLEYPSTDKDGFLDKIDVFAKIAVAIELTKK